MDGTVEGSSDGILLGNELGIIEGISRDGITLGSNVGNKDGLDASFSSLSVNVGCDVDGVGLGGLPLGTGIGVGIMDGWMLDDKEGYEDGLLDGVGPGGLPTLLSSSSSSSLLLFGVSTLGLIEGISRDGTTLGSNVGNEDGLDASFSSLSVNVGCDVDGVGLGGLPLTVVDGT